MYIYIFCNIHEVSHNCFVNFRYCFEFARSRGYELFAPFNFSKNESFASMPRDDGDRHQIQRHSESRFRKRIDSLPRRGRNDRSLFSGIYTEDLGGSISSRCGSIVIEIRGPTRGSSYAIVVLLEFPTIRKFPFNGKISRISNVCLHVLVAIAIPVYMPDGFLQEEESD